MNNKKNSKKRVTHKEIMLDEFLRDEEGVFDDEDEDSVTDDTLEFLSLDDDMIEAYQREHKSTQISKRKTKISERYEEDEDEEYEDEDDEYEDEEYEDEDDEYEDEEYEDEDDEYEDEEYEDEDDEYEDEEYEDEDDEYEGEEYEDEDDEYEDEEYEDEDDEYEDDEYEDGGVIVRFMRFLTDMSTMDMIVAMLGIVVLAGVIVTGGLYVNAKSVEKQVETFASVGEELEGISIIGESGLLAVAESAKLSHMIDIEETFEEEEQVQNPEEAQSKTIDVTLNLTSIQSDIKIKFVNKATGKLIGGVPFEVEVSGGGTTLSYQDDDKDGIIYKTEIPAGTYNVTVKPLGDAYQDYRLPTAASSVTVTDTIAYKKVDVADEVKTEAEVNVAAEDTAVQDTVVESSLKDTVEWVESTKTPVGDGKESYEAVPKANIPDPWTTSSVYRKMSATEPNPSSETTDPEGENKPDTDEENKPNPDEENKPGPSASKPTITISSSSLSLEVGNTATLYATVSNAEGASVEWKSSNESVATLNGNEVKAVAAGSATITATATAADGQTASASCTVEVTEAAKPEIKVSVTLNQTGVSLKKGEVITLTATPEPSGSSVTWSSSNESVAKVDNGQVAAVGAGNATITATVSADGKSASATCSVTVTEDKPAIKISLDQTAVSLKKGESITIKPTPEPSGSAVTWSSSNESVAKVVNGKVTAVGAGNATITATVSADGKSASATCSVTVTEDKPTIKVSLDQANVTLKKGATATLKVKVEGTNNPKVTWSSSSTSVATVKDGTVTAAAVGTAIITASVTVDGTTYSANCTVTVQQADAKITISGPSEVAIGKTITLTVQTEPKDSKVVWSSANEKIAKVDAKGVVTGIAAGSTEIKVCFKSDTNTYATYKVTVGQDGTAKLKDKDGNQLYYKDSKGVYREATYNDYKKQSVFYKKTAVFSEYKYTGWQTIDGHVYFFDKEGNFVTGEQVIQGAKYNFSSEGKLSSGSGTMGIDVSKWNGSIDWNAVKNSGVSYVIIRCGYRGSSTGALIEDPLFRSNIKGAKAAGLKVGAYFFSQAVNEVEAVEEASMAVNLCSGYGLNYPIFLDVESSGGRGDGVSRETRTAVCKAFCATVQNSGFSAGIYANKTWFNEKISTGSLTGYKIWLAQYASAPTYTATRYDMWQYSSKGKVSGISGSVDMNISYMSY